MKNIMDVVSRLDNLEKDFPESLKGYTGLESAFLNLPPLKIPMENLQDNDPQKRLELIPDIAMALSVAIDISVAICNQYIKHPEQFVGSYEEWNSGGSTMTMIRLTSEHIHRHIARATALLKDDRSEVWDGIYNDVQAILNRNPDKNIGGSWEAWEAVLWVVLNEKPEGLIVT